MQKLEDTVSSMSSTVSNAAADKAALIKVWSGCESAFVEAYGGAGFDSAGDSQSGKPSC